ncbi:MAG TPA: methyltransferase domain-containing protein [Gemmatimonadales bacterium]|nr:methyltransferase domain-containing protein [Gemmatimonadales bacterium]
MAPIDYLVLRVVRRYMPERLVRLLLRRGLIIRPGIETRAPAAAFRRFMDAIERAGETVLGRRILIFGYGGRLDVALALLGAGARHVVLVDPYAAPVPITRSIAAPGGTIFDPSGLPAVPLPGLITVIHAPLGQYLSKRDDPVDIVLSNSVLEHVGDVAGAARELAQATAPGGQHFHFIDLRDHFSRYPFEMLCYSEGTWRRFLNPGSNLNRLRVFDYERLFSAVFQHVSVQVRDSQPAAFRAVRSRIRPEFLTGDEQRDAVTQVLLRAW